MNEVEGRKEMKKNKNLINFLENAEDEERRKKKVTKEILSIHKEEQK